MNQDQILGIIRHALTFVGGVLVIKGFQSEGATQEVIGGIMAAVSLVWSYLTKK